MMIEKSTVNRKKVILVVILSNEKDIVHYVLVLKSIDVLGSQYAFSLTFTKY